MLRGSLPELTPFFARGPVDDFANHRLAVERSRSTRTARSDRVAQRCSNRTRTSRQPRLLTTPPEEVYAQTLAAAKAGFQVGIHAIGDRANREAMDIFERVEREVPGSRALRMRIEHAQILDAAEIPRFAKLGVIASMQPTHATSDMPWAATRSGTPGSKRARMPGESFSILVR